MTLIKQRLCFFFFLAQCHQIQDDGSATPQMDRSHRDRGHLGFMYHR
jgi:hypothetical protein